MNKGPARWLRAMPPAERVTRLAYLIAGIKEMRQLEHGYDAADGYNIRDIKSWPAARVKKLTEAISSTHLLKTRPYTLTRPRSDHSKKVLAKHTGRPVTKKTKAVLVHTTIPNSRVRVKGNKIETVTDVITKDGEKKQRVQRDYYFPFKRAPRDWDDFMAMAYETVKRLPPGVYSIKSSRYDLIGVPMLRENIMQNMQRWYDKYEPNQAKAAMVETLIGLRWVGYDRKQSDSFLARYVDTVAKNNAWRAKAERKEKDRIKANLSPAKKK